MDCTKYGDICETFGVDSYPYILYVNKHSRFHYKGDRNVDSMFDFAQRVHGPDIKTVDSCKSLKDLVENHGLVVLAVESNLSSDYFEQFKFVARSLKTHFWFYHTRDICQGYSDKGLYLLKRFLRKPIKFDSSSSTTERPKLREAITKWISQESYPIYGPINHQNFDQRLATGKILAIAALDLYTPAGMLSQSSKLFQKFHLPFVKVNAQNEEQLLFAWSTDIELLQSIAIRRIPLPNYILIRPDYSYHLVIEEKTDEDKNEIPEKLLNTNLIDVIKAAKSGKLNFYGGNSIVHKIFRKIFTQYASYKRMFEANPLLATILLGLPFTIISVVFYTTCRDDQVCARVEKVDNNEDVKDDEESDDDDDDDGNYDEDEDFDDENFAEEEEQALLNHTKQE